MFDEVLDRVLDTLEVVEVLKVVLDPGGLLELAELVELENLNVELLELPLEAASDLAVKRERTAQMRRPNPQETILPSP